MSTMKDIVEHLEQVRHANHSGGNHTDPPSDLSIPPNLPTDLDTSLPTDLDTNLHTDLDTNLSNAPSDTFSNTPSDTPYIPNTHIVSRRGSAKKKASNSSSNSQYGGSVVGVSQYSGLVVGGLDSVMDLDATLGAGARPDRRMSNSKRADAIGKGHSGTFQQVVKDIRKEQKGNDCSLTNEKNTALDGTCLPDNVLTKIAAGLSDSKHGTPPGKTNRSKNMRSLASDVAKSAGTGDPLETVKSLTGCADDKCIISHPVVQKVFAKGSVSFFKQFYKPSGPKQGNAWLSNFNIDDFGDQLAQRFPTHAHLKFQMIDFDKLDSELNRDDVYSRLFDSGKTSVSVVINTDTSKGSGIHWFCVYAEKYDEKSCIARQHQHRPKDGGDNTPPDVPHIDIEYFNSSGAVPEKSVDNFIQRQTQVLRKTYAPMGVHTIGFTSRNFQQDSSSCGVYCCGYIWLRLSGVPVEEFHRDEFNDRFMVEMREMLFTDIFE